MEQHSLTLAMRIETSRRLSHLRLFIRNSHAMHALLANSFNQTRSSLLLGRDHCSIDDEFQHLYIEDGAGKVRDWTCTLDGLHCGAKVSVALSALWALCPAEPMNMIKTVIINAPTAIRLRKCASSRLGNLRLRGNTLIQLQAEVIEFLLILTTQLRACCSQSSATSGLILLPSPSHAWSLSASDDLSCNVWPQLPSWITSHIQRWGPARGCWSNRLQTVNSGFCPLNFDDLSVSSKRIRIDLNAFWTTLLQWVSPSTPLIQI